jgi:hypothetical protein
MAVGPQQIKQIIMQELPALLQQDREIQEFILQLSRDHFADKRETESRFDRMLEDLRRDREEQTRKWEEQNRKWEENQRLLWQMQEEEARKWEEQNRKWEEQNRKWEEQNRKWEENTARLDRMLDSIEALARKHDSTIGALGARWGLHAEQSFRNALKGILEKSFGVEVRSVIEYDDQGEVFGCPDQVELDVLIKDGMLILCEIRSSMSKSDMYTFDRKVAFYEKRHERQATRRLVISPMVEEKAKEVARRLGIEVYSYAEEVPLTGDTEERASA